MNAGKKHALRKVLLTVQRSHSPKAPQSNGPTVQGSHSPEVPHARGFEVLYWGFEVLYGGFEVLYWGFEVLYGDVSKM